MKRAEIEGEPEIEEGTVVIRIVVEDPAREDSGGIFLCRMRGFGDVSVERFPRDLAPSADGRLRAIAAITAVEYAIEHHDAFEELFAKLRPH